MNITHLIFVSSLSNEYGRDLPTILEASSKNNDAEGVSAVILCRHGNVMGLLQGHSKQVHNAFGRMSNDLRHFGLTKLYDAEAQIVEFSGTSAGLGSSELAYVKSLAPSLNVFKATADTLNQMIQPGTCRDLLLNFVETNF